MISCPSCGAGVPEGARFCAACGASLTDTSEREAAAPAPEPAHDARLQEAVRTALAPRYELVSPLGQGGMGTVFLARETALKRLVAVKVLEPALAAADQARARFEREAHAVAALSHPNIVSVYGVGETGDLELPYIVMQYIDGTSLSRWLADHGRAGERDARRILGGVAAALAAAHARGFVHRDVKPGNVLLEASSGRVFLADFGVAAALPSSALGEDSKLTVTGSIVGTPIYMSPEQVAGEPAGAASDVYSFGIMAYELLTGKLPFDANSAMGWAAAHLRDVPAPVASQGHVLSLEIARLVDRCLAKRPEGRPTAAELTQALLPSIDTELAWPPPGLASLFGRTRGLTRFAVVCLLAGLLLLVALARPPDSVRGTGPWWSRYGGVASGASTLGVRNEAPDMGGGVPIWWVTVLALGVVGTGLGWLGLVASSYRALVAAAAQRERGWRWDTLLDVAADPDGRSGLLLAGSREFAAVRREDRQAVLRARRASIGYRLAAGGWVATVLGLWALAVVLGVWPLPGAKPVAGLGLVLLIVVPTLIGLVGAARAALREARLLDPLPRRRRYTGAFPIASGNADAGEVAGWYAMLSPQVSSQDRAPTSVPATGRLNVIRAAHLTAAAAGLIWMASFGVVAGAVVVAGSGLQRLGAETAELAATLERPADQDPVAAARMAMLPYLPQSGIGADTDAVVEWVRALRSNDAPTAGIPYPLSPAQLVGPVTASGSGYVQMLASGRPANLRLPPDTARLFETLADHPRTVLFRKLARAPGIDLMPDPPYGPLREAAQANALAAVLAAARGDYASARERLGENAAVAGLFLRTPRLFAARFAAGMLQDLSLLPLAGLEELRGNAAQAAQLRTVAADLREDVYNRAWTTRMAGLGADPDDLARLTAALRDKRLLPGIRMESLEGGFAAFCLNPREILSGPSPARRATVLRVAYSMTDVAQASRLAELVAGEWETRSLTRAGGVPGWVSFLAGWPGGAVLVRLSACSRVFH